MQIFRAVIDPNIPQITKNNTASNVAKIINTNILLFNIRFIFPPPTYLFSNNKRGLSKYDKPPIFLPMFIAIILIGNWPTKVVNVVLHLFSFLSNNPLIAGLLLAVFDYWLHNRHKPK